MLKMEPRTALRFMRYSFGYIVHHSLPSAAHLPTSFSTENIRRGSDSKRPPSVYAIDLQWNRLVAAAIQESARVKLRKTWDAGLSILFHVDEFVKQQSIRWLRHRKLR
jgi:hypothetical protein